MMSLPSMVPDVNHGREPSSPTVDSLTEGISKLTLQGVEELIHDRRCGTYVLVVRTKDFLRQGISLQELSHTLQEKEKRVAECLM